MPPLRQRLRAKINRSLHYSQRAAAKNVTNARVKPIHQELSMENGLGVQPSVKQVAERPPTTIAETKNKKVILARERTGG